MNEDYLQEIKTMENRLYDIINLIGIDALESKLGDAWSILYDYLKEQGLYPNE